MAVALAVEAIAKNAPQLFKPALEFLATLAKLNPDAVVTASQLLANIATNVTQQLHSVLQVLQHFMLKNPELLPIASKLLLKFSNNPVLLELAVSILNKVLCLGPEQQALNTQILALLELATAAPDEQALTLLQKTFDLCQNFSQANALLEHPFLKEELKKLKKKQINERNSHADLDILIRWFDQFELDDWKTAAEFRKTLRERGLGVRN
jgi:hypothetical protein